MITLRNAHLLVGCDDELGAQITHVSRPGAENMLFMADWASPVSARSSSGYGSDVLDWLSSYRGGWQELFPSGGDASTVMGVPLPFHGEVSAAAWRIVHKHDDSVTLRCPARLPLILERTMRLDPERPVLLLEERAINESELEVPFIWGHHPAFMVGPETVLDVPSGTLKVSPDPPGDAADLVSDGDGVWPDAPALDGSTVDLRRVPTEPTERLIYLPDVNAGWAALRHEDRGAGVAMAWDADTFPHLWMWQQIGGTGFPFFARARLTALEPNRVWPADGLANAISRGQELRLGPRGEYATWLTMALFESARRAVVGVSRDGIVEEGGA